MRISNKNIVQFSYPRYVGDTITFMAFGRERRGYVSDVANDGRISAVFTMDEHVFCDFIVDTNMSDWFKYGKNNKIQHSPVYPISSTRVVIVEKFVWPFKKTKN